MVIIRPAREVDLDQLLELATLTSFGLTTLPRDREFLRKRIAQSQSGFARMDEDPRGDSFLLVLEDLRTGKAVGTSGIVSKVGGFEPFYAYRVENSVHESTTLGVRKEIQTLHLVAEHNGPCEIGSLFLHPDYRESGNGRLLSLARFLFMAEHPKPFDPVVIAEMRGVIDEHGHSPFWDALGRHFFDMEYPKADYLSVLNKRFIADLMPKHPIYIPLLPAEARAVIGQVHEQTKPALKILESEGFRSSGMVDIFEAGPVVICERNKIRTVRQSTLATVADVGEAPMAGELYVITNARPEFRACKGNVEWVEPTRVRLNAAAALALGLKIGDKARVAPMRPANNEART